MSPKPVSTRLWTDPKRHLWLLSAAPPLLGTLALALFHGTGLGALTWGGPLAVYLLVLWLEWRVGTDAANPPEEAVAELEGDRWYRQVLYAYLPLQLLLTLWGGWLFLHRAIGWEQQLGLVLTVGAVNGLAINTAHELSHKRDGLRRWLAKLALAPSGYGHFFVEHVRGHHRRVATPEDPASARMGEGFWHFLPRTVLGGLASGWRLEAERLARHGHRAWSPRNDNLQAWSLTALLFGAMLAWLGPRVLAFLALQMTVAVVLLEVINYIEHYGLLRQKGPDGRYERCSPQHSWNSNHVVTNVLLYQLQRHADHHAHPLRSFQALRHFDDSPQLPGGYTSLLLPALVPPLWFRLMDPLVLAHYQGDLTRANLQPRQRARLMAAYPPPASAAATPDPAAPPLPTLPARAA